MDQWRVSESSPSPRGWGSLVYERVINDDRLDFRFPPVLTTQSVGFKKVRYGRERQGEDLRVPSQSVHGKLERARSEGSVAFRI